MKHLYIILLTFCMLGMTSCDQASLQRALDTVSQAAGLTDGEVGSGLKEALNFGVTDAVNFLSKDKGYTNSIYKILLPDEAQKVVNKLKFIPGFTDLEGLVVKKINQGAEDAAKKAGPIFKDAITGITFDDAMNILMGNNDAATQYLHGKTYNKLYDEFMPVLTNSLNKFGALDLWSDAISKYNSLPLVDDINPDLADHVNSKALVGLFDLVEKKESGIRTDVGQRSTALLRKVFAQQDN